MRGHRFGYIVVGKFKMLFSEGRRDLLTLHVHLSWGRVGGGGGVPLMGESTVLCYTVSGKCCVSRFSLRGFGIRYLMLKPDATEWPLVD